MVFGDTREEFPSRRSVEQVLETLDERNPLGRAGWRLQGDVDQDCGTIRFTTLTERRNGPHAAVCDGLPRQHVEQTLLRLFVVQSAGSRTAF